MNRMQAGGVVPSSGELWEASAPKRQLKEKVMKFTRALAIAALTGATILGSGCAMIRGQETVGAYIDDASITTAVKAKFVEDKTVDAGAIKVETLKGAVALSGFAKSNAEKAQAEYIARNTKGVKEVHNNLVVRP
jgi:hyperosmotically inducible periplasmic protein